MFICRSGVSEIWNMVMVLQNIYRGMDCIWFGLLGYDSGLHHPCDAIQALNTIGKEDGVWPQNDPEQTTE